MQLEEYIVKEQKKINEEIARHVRSLPTSVQPIARHIFSTRGKRIRPLLVILFARHFGYTKEDIYSLACSIEYIHSATLLHDDIIDSSVLRRGVETAHTLYSSTSVILAGDALLAKACVIVAKRGIPSLLVCVSSAILETVHGEILETEGEGNVLSWECYFEIIKGKTACMFERACEMGALCANISDREVEKVSMIGLAMGMAFQIMDDILDYEPSQITGKPKGKDLQEGKITAPILYYMDTLIGDKKEIFIQRLLNKDFSPEECDTVIEEIKRASILDKTYVLVTRYVQEAICLLETFSKTEEQRLLIELLSHIARKE
ncbi:MAG: polyprenyl synthetase family protein [Desulfovibrionaceae bacterium]